VREVLLRVAALLPQAANVPSGELLPLHPG
jgi:hypothetical protein